MMRRIYRLMLRRLPPEFHRVYGAEMEEAFLESFSIAQRRLPGLGAPYALLRAAWDVHLLAGRLKTPQPRRQRSSWTDGFLQDLRIGVRRLLRAPAFTVASVATLGLGIGAVVIMVTLVDAILLRPLPYAESDRLVALFLHEKGSDARRSPTSPANFHAWRSESETLSLMTAAHPWSPSLTGRDRPDELRGLKASPSLFRLLDAKPLLGRTFDEGDEGDEGDDRVVVLGYDLWRRRFGEDPSIVGETLMLDGEAHVVAGVMPRGFRFPPFWTTEAEMWAPLSFNPEEAARHARFLRVFARLNPGVSLEEARREMETIGARLVTQFPRENVNTAINTEPLLEPVVAEARPALLLLLAAVVLLALIACANVANLKLVRAAGRAKDAALAAALGAGRAHRLRQQLTESLLLAALGGLAGASIALWGVPAIVEVAPAGLPRLAEIGVDSRLLFYAVLVSVAVALFLSIVSMPRATVTSALREAGTRATDFRGRRLRDVLVVSQVATSAMLLVAAGLVIRSFHALQTLDPGFRRDELLTSSLLLAGSNHTEPERQDTLFRQIRESVGAIPGVRSVALINHLPIGGDIWGLSFVLDGAEAVDAGELPRASQRTVTPSYFETMGIPLLAGRDFTNGDGERAERVTIVNRTLAERYASIESILGRRIRIGQPEGEDWRTVVGVASDSRQWDLTQDVPPEIYFPYAQNPVSFYLTTSLVVASRETPDRLQPQIERAVWSVAGEIPIVDVRTMERILSDHVAPRRFTSLLFGVFAALALVLAAIGLYGVLSYTVSQQTVEIGIRAALGATRGDIGSLVLFRGARLVGIGLLLGFGAALLARGLVSGLLFGVTAYDPTTFAVVSFFLILVALVAVVLPARRAARLDPLRALRSE
jgi:putative ABC transport system permease protein